MRANLMFAGFATYDLTHMVTFEKPFATTHFTTGSGKKIGFYFVVDADKIKAWIEQKQIPEM